MHTDRWQQVLRGLHKPEVNKLYTVTAEGNLHVYKMSSKYGVLTLPQLKEELRKRNAKVSGRKQELVER